MQHSLGVVQLHCDAACSLAYVQMQMQYCLAQTTACSVQQRAPLLFLNLSMRRHLPSRCRIWGRGRVIGTLPPVDCPSADESPRASKPDEPSTGDEVASAMLTCTSLGHSLLLSAATPCARCVCSNVSRVCVRCVQYKEGNIKLRASTTSGSGNDEYRMAAGPHLLGSTCL
jgi:hypothetical protein